MLKLDVHTKIDAPMEIIVGFRENPFLIQGSNGKKNLVTWLVGFLFLFVFGQNV